MGQAGDSSNHRKQYGTTVSIDTVSDGSTLVAPEDIWVICQTFFFSSVVRTNYELANEMRDFE